MHAWHVKCLARFSTLQRLRAVVSACSGPLSCPSDRRTRAQAGDLFAFGMLLVSMLSGEAPWAGRSGPQIVLAAGIVHLRPSPPPCVPPALACLIDMCLRTEPAQRPTFEVAGTILRGLLVFDCAGAPQQAP